MYLMYGYIKIVELTEQANSPEKAPVRSLLQPKLFVGFSLAEINVEPAIARSVLSISGNGEDSCKQSKFFVWKPKVAYGKL